MRPCHQFGCETWPGFPQLIRGSLTVVLRGLEGCRSWKPHVWAQEKQGNSVLNRKIRTCINYRYMNTMIIRGRKITWLTCCLCARHWAKESEKGGAYICLVKTEQSFDFWFWEINFCHFCLYIFALHRGSQLYMYTQLRVTTGKFITGL